MFNKFLLTFIPMFVAMGIIENVPIFMMLTEGMKGSVKSRVIRQTMITATAIVVVFALVGSQILIFLGISLADFMVAGGLLLFILSIKTVIEDEDIARKATASAGIVPLGTPLIAGPAVLAITLLLANMYGVTLTLASFVICIALQGVAFYYAERLIKILGRNGAKAFTKITAIFLAAIAVMLVRRGLIEILQLL